MTEIQLFEFIISFTLQKQILVNNENVLTLLLMYTIFALL